MTVPPPVPPLQLDPRLPPEALPAEDVRPSLRAPLTLCSSPLQSSVCAKIVQLLGQNEVDYHHRQVVILSQDSFYRVLTSEQKAKALKGQFNFDHPGEWGVKG